MLKDAYIYVKVITKSCVFL